MIIDCNLFSTDLLSNDIKLFSNTVFIFDESFMFIHPHHIF